MNSSELSSRVRAVALLEAWGRIFAHREAGPGGDPYPRAGYHKKKDPGAPRGLAIDTLPKKGLDYLTVETVLDDLGPTFRSAAYRRFALDKTVSNRDADLVTAVVRAVAAALENGGEDE